MAQKTDKQQRSGSKQGSTVSENNKTPERTHSSERSMDDPTRGRQGDKLEKAQPHTGPQHKDGPGDKK